MNTIDFDKIDLTQQPPAEEPQRQYYFIAKCREYVRQLKDRYGRSPLCFTQTFGCPNVSV